MITVHYKVEKMPCILQQVKRDGEHRVCHSQGPWRPPKPPLCTSSAPAFPHKGQGWITPLMQHSWCWGLQLLDTWPGVVAKGWRGHPWLGSAQGPAPACQPSAHLTAEQESTLCWSHEGCKAPPSSSSLQHNQEGCTQGWLWLLPQPGDALPGPPQS